MQLPKPVFKFPLRTHDAATQQRGVSYRFLDSRRMSADSWNNQMLKAQSYGRRIAYSYEWFIARRHFENSSYHQGSGLAYATIWTGTVIDFTDETLKEGIRLNENGTIETARIVLGRKDGIRLPHSNVFLKDLGEEYIPLFSYLTGLKDPKKELGDRTFWVADAGIRPVVCKYGYILSASDNIDESFNAVLVSDTVPRDTVTQETYESLKMELMDTEMIRAGAEARAESIKNRLIELSVLVK